MDQIPSAQNPIKYKLAHIHTRGVDLILIPLDSSIETHSIADQGEIHKSFQMVAGSAGLRGNIVLVWDKGGGATGFLSESHIQSVMQKITYEFVQTKLNREMSVKGIGRQIRMPAPGGPASSKADALTATAAPISGNDRRSASTRTLPSGFNNSKNEESSSTIGTTKIEAALDTFNRGKVEAFKQKSRSGLMTLLFTDIVGSTRLKQELGDHQAVTRMQQHHQLVRNILSGIPTGEEISTAGDSFFLVFEKPSDAVKFSLLLQAKQRAIAKGAILPIYDRIGIHVGEVFIEQSEGSNKLKDLFGIQVDTCARVMSLAEGDQILLTRFAFDNARQVLKGQTIEGVGPLAWVNHGPYELKGVEDPLDICEVGEVGIAVLKPPSDSEKVHRYYPPGTRPTEPTGPHVVVSRRSSGQRTFFPSR